MSTSQTKFEALKLTNDRIRRLKSSHMTALLEAQKATEGADRSFCNGKEQGIDMGLALLESLYEDLKGFDMGVASIIGKHVLSVELDCFDSNGIGFSTLDVDIHYEVLARRRNQCLLARLICRRWLPALQELVR